MATIKTPDIERPDRALVAKLAEIGSATATGELSRLGIRDPHLRGIVSWTPGKAAAETAGDVTPSAATVTTTDPLTLSLSYPMSIRRGARDGGPCIVARPREENSLSQRMVSVNAKPSSAS